MSAGNAESAPLTDPGAAGPQSGARVLAAGTLIDIGQYESEPGRFATVLSQAKAEHGHALCLCTEPKPHLVVRRIPDPGGDRFFLATWPNGGMGHAAGCRFFRSESDYQDARAKALAAVVESDQGFNIKPGFSLRRLELPDTVESTPRALPREPSVANAPAPQRDSLSLRDTLRYLWTASGLDLPKGDGRRWGDAVVSLRSVVEQGSVGSVSLRSVLYVVPVFEASLRNEIDAAWTGFVEHFQRTASAVPLFLVLGEVKTTQRAGQAVATHLRHHGPPLFMSLGLAKALADRFPSEEECLVQGGAGDRVIGLFQVEISARNRLWVNDAALMRVSGAYALARDCAPPDQNPQAPA